MSVATPLPPPSDSGTAPPSMADTWCLDRVSRPLEGLSAKLPCTAALLKFDGLPDVWALPVLLARKPIGLLSRSAARANLQEMVGTAMDPRPLILPHDMPLETVSRMVAEHHPRALTYGVITVDPATGHYSGFVPGIDLLRGTLEQFESTLSFLRAAQGDLVQAEKFASLGQLVAGIAHEINTPLGIGLTAATHLTERTRSFQSLSESGGLKRSDLTGFLQTVAEGAEIITANLGRAAELVHSFKQVAADQTSAVRRSFSVAQLIEDLISSLSPRLRKAAQKVQFTCLSDGEMDSFPGPLGQVITNLILNALTHAYDETSRDGRIEIAIECKGGNVIIGIKDDGCGIPPSHLPRIFDPFFTTKRGKGGTGLGLHLVYNIVTQTLGGRIGCTSAVDVGTAFTLILPLTAPDRAQGDRPKEASLGFGDLGSMAAAKFGEGDE